MPAAIGTLLVTQRFGNHEARTLAGYEKTGGYTQLRKALAMRPEDITAEVKASNLRGRGGAGFSTGVKWGFVPKDAKAVHLVCNADESEPGTCKDRELMYWDPHLLIEGMVISAHALHAVHNYIYIRGEMMREYVVLQKAVDEAYARGYLGKNILGTGVEVQLTVHRGAGAYICGEETTLMNVPAIIEKGGAWFNGLGMGRSGGTRMVCVSGHVNKPGVFELPMGITFTQMIDDVCGGVWKGRRVKAVIPGGVSMPPLDAGE